MIRAITALSLSLMAVYPAFAGCDNGNSKCSAVDTFSQENNRSNRPAANGEKAGPSFSGINVQTLSNGAQVRVSEDGKYGVDRYGRRVRLGN
jgi:hypothetical protein